jgi:hypothetical protein
MVYPFAKKADAMKNILLFLMLAFVSTSAMAKWTAIGDSSDFPITYYLDFETIHKHGQRVSVSELMDFEAPQELNGNAGRYLSSTLKIEFDCNEKQSRILSFHMYAGNMASKDIVYSAKFPSARWEPIPPNSVTKDLWNSACVKM